MTGEDYTWPQVRTARTLRLHCSNFCELCSIGTSLAVVPGSIDKSPILKSMPEPQGNTHTSLAWLRIQGTTRADTTMILHVLAIQSQTISTSLELIHVTFDGIATQPADLGLIYLCGLDLRIYYCGGWECAAVQLHVATWPIRLLLQPWLQRGKHVAFPSMHHFIRL